MPASDLDLPERITDSEIEARAMRAERDSILALLRDSTAREVGLRAEIAELKRELVSKNGWLERLREQVNLLRECAS